MTLTVHPGIGTQTLTASILPKRGDREDFLLRVQGPDPSTDFQVPLSITGTALAIWGSPNPVVAAETLGAAIFKVSGTAGQPPAEGFWFDSYNSGPDLHDTESRIANLGANPFIKNKFANQIKGLGQDINDNIQLLDESFTSKYGVPFFKSLEDLSEESQRVDDLSAPARDNANFLYKVSILAGIIDHIDVKLASEDAHICTTCKQRHKQSEGTLQRFKRWLVDKYDTSTADRLTITFQMIKNLRKQYPIHDHYVTANNIRQERTVIEDANNYFSLRKGEFENNASLVVNKFSESLKELKEYLESN